MAFKLVVFIAILIVVAVAGTRGYRAAVARFERERQPRSMPATAPGEAED